MAERSTPGMKVALTIAGSDPSGGAGIQADLKVFAAMGVFGATAITAVTVQNTTGVKDKKILDGQFVDQQIAIVADDIEVDATKTGMLGNEANVVAVAKAVKRHKLEPLVVDPVMVATSGDSLLDEGAVKTLTQHLLPLAAVVTPNGREAAALLGHNDPIEDVFAATEAARQICSQYGARACVVTGIHRPNDHEGEAVDVYFDGNQVQELVSEWRQTTNLHGTGCTFSAAITAALAKGQPIDEAVQTAKAVVSEAVRQTTDLGRGASPINHLAYANVK